MMAKCCWGYLSRNREVFQEGMSKDRRHGEQLWSIIGQVVLGCFPSPNDRCGGESKLNVSSSGGHFRGMRTNAPKTPGQMLEQCLKNARGGIVGVISGRRTPDSTTVGQLVTRVAPNRTNVGQIRPASGQIWSNACRCWSNLGSGARNDSPKSPLRACFEHLSSASCAPPGGEQMASIFPAKFLVARHAARQHF